MRQNKTKIIGLTGNSGSGKTTASNILKQYGYFVVNCDKIAHEVLNIGEACYFDVINYFGDSVLNDNKTINRQKLGDIVFSDKAKLKILTEMTHKYIIKIVIEKVNEICNSGKYSCVIIDAPVLINTPLMHILDEVWIVYANRENSIDRIIKRDSLKIEQAEKRLYNQPSYEELKKHADFLILNNGTLDDLKKIIHEKTISILFPEKYI